MPAPVPVLIPLLNPNEPEAQVAAILVAEGQAVARGDILCTLETTKAAADLTAETQGYIVGLRLSPGQTAPAGTIFCYLADSPAWEPPASPPAPEPPSGTSLPHDLRISHKALRLAQEKGLDLSLLPQGVFITEELVHSALESVHVPQVLPITPGTTAEFDPTAILVYGGGGHGKSLIDLLRALGIYRIVGVIDDRLKPDSPPIMGLPVLGGAEALPGLSQQGVRLAVNAVGGIGNLSIRIQVFERLRQAGFTCPAVVHPSAVVEPSAVLAEGVQVFPLAYVGSEARLGYGAIVNTGAIVSHDCLIGDYANCSPGAILAGEVTLGSAVLVGMAATVNLRTRIGDGARIGNGATVKAEVPPGGIVRAGTIWPA